MGTLGRQSRQHAQLARRQLAEARRASEQTRARCSAAFPAIVQARESLAAAWENISGIADTSPRNRRMKNELQLEHREVNRRIKRDVEAFGHRCVVHPLRDG